MSAAFISPDGFGQWNVEPLPVPTLEVFKRWVGTLLYELPCKGIAGALPSRKVWTGGECGQSQVGMEETALFFGVGVPGLSIPSYEGVVP